MKLRLEWNDLYFMFTTPIRTELFSIEHCKEYNFIYTKIRNKICITLCNKNGSYIEPKTFNDED